MKTRLAALVALLVALGACASPPPTPASPPPTPENRYGAPPVSAPRDLSSRATDPCATLLTDPEIERLGYTPPGSPEISILGAPMCVYQDDDSRRDAYVTVEPDRDLLVDTYRTRVFDILVPTFVDGLPATQEMSFPEALTCTTVVGISSTQAINVSTSVEGGGDGPPPIAPCDDGRRVAEAVVSTLPPA